MFLYKSCDKIIATIIMIQLKSYKIDIEIENNGKTLIGEFHANDGKIIDHFKLNDLIDFYKNFSIFLINNDRIGIKISNPICFREDFAVLYQKLLDAKDM